MHTAAAKLFLPGFFTCHEKRIVVLFLYFICVIIKCYAQPNGSGTSFRMEGQIHYRDTGSMAIWYRNADNEFRRDTIKLHQGQFSLSGTVNGATEVLIWTNPKNIYYDDPSIVQFLLVPGLVTINKPNELENAMISGSYAQEEKEKWDKVKLPLTAKGRYCIEKANSLRKVDQATGKPLHKNIIDSLYRVYDSIKTVRLKLDLDYVVKNPGTYLSMYLLWHWAKAIPVDSLVKLFSGFPDSVTKSSLAYDVLKYIYPLTDNQSFRMKYPLHGTAFQNQLERIRSIHDFKLASITGKEVDLKIFRGKYLVVDVWASWCKPCIANIPAWNDLMKEYDPKLIQFISVSLDDNAADWKKAIEKHKPAGVQVLDSNAFAGLFAVYCRIAYLPRYLIVDPAGQIINYSAPHPRQPELRNLLNALVKKKD